MSIAFTIFLVLIAVRVGLIYKQNVQVPSLGVKDGQLQPLSSKPNNVSTQSDEKTKRIRTLETKETLEATMSAIKQAISGYEGKATILEETDDYLYVVFTTGLMRFRDDAEFWVDFDNNDVHFRSSSRAGTSDLGLNRKRYKKLTELYNAL